MEKHVEKCLKSLKSRHFQSHFAAGFDDACTIALNLIPESAVVGLGDSSTVRRIGLLEKMEKQNLAILNPFKIQPSDIEPMEAQLYTNSVSTQASVCDVFITGTNAITQDGRIVNVDAVGNRVAGMFWGHPVSIIIVGKNKIVKDLDAAFERIRYTIAPNHSYLKSSGAENGAPKTPCVKTGECTDCRSSNRTCNIFTIIESKPVRTNLHVILINEDLGLGWDPEWPEERIQRIIENHKRYMWKPRFKMF
jgi:hypothetical protein